MKHRRNTRTFFDFSLGKYHIQVYHVNKQVQTTDMDGNVVGTITWRPHWGVQKLVIDYGRRPGGYLFQMGHLFLGVYL